MEAAIGKEQTQNLIKESLFIISAGTNDFVVNYNTLPIRSKTYKLSNYTDFLLQHLQLFLQVGYPSSRIFLQINIEKN